MSIFGNRNQKDAPSPIEPQLPPAPPIDVEARIREMIALVDPNAHPNSNRLNELIRNIPLISLNLKVYGYELARAMASERPRYDNLTPAKVELRSKPSTQADIESAWVAYWMNRLKAPVVYHRKIWELCYVLQALYNFDLIRPGARGVGFGCGEEALPSLLASEGVSVVVTDLEPADDRAKSWQNSGEHTDSLERSFRSDLVAREAFDRNVSLRRVDMTAIPEDLRDYDFCWSICALEHLGSIAKGLDFIENSLDCLKPGGVSVHTTEFNFGDDAQTIDEWPTVLFQKAHFTALAERLRAKGHQVAELDFDVGTKPLDRFIDLPPWPDDMTPAMRRVYETDTPAHIKLSVDGFPTTCFGMIVRKAP